MNDDASRGSRRAVKRERCHTGWQGSRMAESNELDQLRRRFGEDMRRGIGELANLGYDATLFRGMVAALGAVEAARRLALAPVPSYGLWRLKELGQLSSSVEMWVLLPWYEPLFGPEVRRQAEDKLRSLDVAMPDELDALIRRLRNA